MKTKTEEEKADSLVGYLDGESFEYYFNNFAEDSAPNEETRTFQWVNWGEPEEGAQKSIPVTENRSRGAKFI